MNKPTKEEAVEHFTKRVAGRLIAILKEELGDMATDLISASPEAGEQRVPSVAGELIDREYSEDDDGPTDLTPSDSEMQKHYDRGEMASPAPLPAEVEAALERWEGDINELYGNMSKNHPDLAKSERAQSEAALSILRAALTEARQPKVVSREGKRIPHKCPVCDGSGQTMQRFDSPGTADYPTARPCIACGGTGIVWSEELGLTVEEPK